MGLLRGHFKACTEEYGESAISRLMSHIREWNYSGDNMDKRWRESCAAEWCFRTLGIPRSHKTGGTKWYLMNDPPLMMSQLSQEFNRLCGLADRHELDALIGGPGFTENSVHTEDLSFWIELPVDLPLAYSLASAVVAKIKKKLQKPIDQDALDGIDVDLFFSS